MLYFKSMIYFELLLFIFLGDIDVWIQAYQLSHTILPLSHFELIFKQIVW
jgi:hypothetical protein